MPVNGPTIGHIVDLKYIPIDDAVPADVSLSPIDLKDWANIVLCDRLFKGIQEELFAVYSQPDAMKINCISVLRVCNPGIKDYELKEAYETSFLSEIYPGVALSKNTVSTFLNDLGKTCSRIVLFMRNRTVAVAIDHDPPIFNWTTGTGYKPTGEPYKPTGMVISLGIRASFTRLPRSIPVISGTPVWISTIICRRAHLRCFEQHPSLILLDRFCS